MARNIEVSRDGSSLRIDSIKDGNTVEQLIPLSKITNVNESIVTVPVGLGNTTETRNEVVVQYQSDGETYTQKIDLAIETNQAGWTDDSAGVTQAISDINSWIGSYSYGSGGSSGTALATEATLASVLSILQQGKDWEGFKVRDTGSGDVVRQTITYDQNTGTYSVSYFELDGTSYTPVGPLEYLDAEAEIAVLNTLLSGVVETDDAATASLDLLTVGGYADDSANYPNYTNGDAAKIRIDEVNGGLKVNQANLDQTEDNVRSFQGATVNQDDITSIYRSTAVNSTADSIKGSAGNLYKFNIVNKDPDPVVVKFYDATSVDPLTDSPLYTVSVPSGDGSSVSDSFDIPIPFSTGIMVRAVEGTADDNTTANGTAPIIEVFYK